MLEFFLSIPDALTTLRIAMAKIGIHPIDILIEKQICKRTETYKLKR